MPITQQEQAVSIYWSENYNPVSDWAGNIEFYFEDENGDVQGGYATVMDDGTFWFDSDQDGWFDYGARLGARDTVHYFDGYDWYEMSMPGGLDGPGGGGHDTKMAPGAKGQSDRPGHIDKSLQNDLDVEGGNTLLHPIDSGFGLGSPSHNHTADWLLA